MLALFKKKPSDLPFNSFAEYYIGVEVVAAGSCTTDQDVFIDGQFHGDISTTGLIELAKNSHVKADISARTAIIEGDYSGNVKTIDELHITSCANVEGSLETTNLIVDKGAIMKAKIKMRRES
ncbi:polymer-forming cytoskeletal protein [Candidatus Saccharibacteria bacterium]|nr:polymer-forming cytoskeletal protein [Candidatus Saccharibacteria bacterium]